MAKLIGQLMDKHGMEAVGSDQFERWDQINGRMMNAAKFLPATINLIT